MAEYSALPVFTDAWIADTAHLERAERGLYFDLLVLIWRSPECRVPADLAWISRKLRCLPDEQSALASIVSEFCQSTGNWITQKRLRKEWEYVRDRVEKRRASAKSRWNKDNQPCERISDAVRSQCVGNAPTPTPTPTPTSVLDTDVSNTPIAPIPKSTGFQLPEWVPEAEWRGFCEMRARIRAPLTDRAKAGIIRSLERLMEDGWPPGAVLDQSTLQAWRGVFPLREVAHGKREMAGQGGAPAGGYRRSLGLEMLRSAAAEAGFDWDGAAESDSRP